MEDQLVEILLLSMRKYFTLDLPVLIYGFVTFDVELPPFKHLAVIEALDDDNQLLNGHLIQPCYIQINSHLD